MDYTRRDFLNVIGSGMLTGCAQRYYYVEKDTLSISYHPEYSVVHLTQEEGERQLHQLANTACVEEEWIFFKPVRGKRGVWYDVGKVQQETKVQMNGEILEKIVDTFTKLNTQRIILHCTHYHIHPLYSLHQRWGSVISERMVDIFSLPSSSDLEFTRLLHTFLQQRGYVLDDSRVVGSQGMYVYTVPRLSNKNLDAAEYFKSLTSKAVREGLQDKDVQSVLRVLRQGGVEADYYSFR